MAYPTNTGTGTQSGSFVDGFVGELVVFMRSLSDAEMVQVSTYLQNKWGI
jgi:hypothetical protein